MQVQQNRSVPRSRGERAPVELLSHHGPFGPLFNMAKSVPSIQANAACIASVAFAAQRKCALMNLETCNPLLDAVHCSSQLAVATPTRGGELPLQNMGARLPLL